MDVLIDYDNVRQIVRRRGPRHVVRTVLDTLPSSLLPDGSAVSFRLYGGWYSGDQLSPAAQTLYAEVERDFPFTFTHHGRAVDHRVRVRASLARSLLIDPATNLLNTYRVRSAPRNLRPKNLPFAGCMQRNQCPLNGVYDLLKTGDCPQPSCPVTVDDTMTRPEQKMVDSMLTVDLIHASRNPPSTLVVVTGDDDLWPGIIMALSFGASVHHVYPDRRSRLPEYHLAASTNYSQYLLGDES